MTIKILNKLVTVSVLSLAFAFVSCDDKQFFDEYQSTNGEWNKSDVKKFTFEQKDTLNPYNLFVNIRNNSDYPYNNLFLIVKMSNSNGDKFVDTLQYQMANPDGTLLGNGFTDFKESKLFYREDYKFPSSGTYTIEIEHAVRANGKVKGDSLLSGISDVGFRVENIN
ncbi:gliding motility lipoprotein GldH [Flavobacterium sp. I3-2]|uniref:gliding motility lipoprotein GldH n=1 Tax=Flavobacterium sp. I3-2 TaxID=2748319 RepID=UPI0015B2BD0E|nr:gliding motility lipoprotein GldH [Flavobacterium sp. I3-2]